MHGIREFATHKSAEVRYVSSTPRGGFDIPTAKVHQKFNERNFSLIKWSYERQNILLRHRPRSRELAPSLFVLTGQSNITNSKPPLAVTEYAASLGYHTVVDGAALATTSIVDISDYPIDAMAVSFYKMFGYPTGVGALIIKKSFLAQLKRPWFAGGTVDIVQVPGNIVTRTHELHEQFEVDSFIFICKLAVLTRSRTVLLIICSYRR